MVICIEIQCLIHESQKKRMRYNIIFYNNYFSVLLNYFIYTLNDGVCQSFVCRTFLNMNTFEYVNRMDILPHLGNLLSSLIRCILFGSISKNVEDTLRRQFTLLQSFYRLLGVPRTAVYKKNYWGEIHKVTNLFGFNICEFECGCNKKEGGYRP